MPIVTNEEIGKALGYDPGVVPPTEQGLVDLFYPIVEGLLNKHVGYAIVQGSYDEYYPSQVNRPRPDPLVDGYAYEVVSNRAVPIDAWSQDHRALVLRNLPVRSITQAWENRAAWEVASPPSWPDESKLTLGLDYYSDEQSPGLNWSGILYRRAGAWSTVERTIRVQYTAGLTAAEIKASYPEIRGAALLTIKQWINQIKANTSDPLFGNAGGVLTSQSLSGWSESYAQTPAAINSGFMRALPPAAAILLEEYRNLAKFIGV